MNKNIALVVVLLLAILFSVFLLDIFKLERKPRPLFDAVPVSTPILIEFHRLETTIERLEKTTYGASLSKTALIDKLLLQKRLFDEVIAYAPRFSESVEKTHLLAAANLTRADRFDLLFLLRVIPWEHAELDVDATFKNLAEKQFGAKTRTYRGTRIFEWKMGEQEITASLRDDIILFSLSPILVEDGITQLDEGVSLLKDPDFSRVNRVAGKDFDATLYIHPKRLKLFSPLLLNPDFYDIINPISDLSGWMELDLMLKSEGLLFNGYAAIEKERANILLPFSGEAPAQISLYDKIPYSAAMVIYAGTDSFSGYAERLKTKTPKAEEALPWFNNWVNREWAFVLGELFDTASAEATFFLVSVKDEETALESLLEVNRLRKDTAEEVEEITEDELEKRVETGYYRFSDGHLLNEIFGPGFPNLIAPWFTILNEVVIFGNSLPALKQYVGLIQGGKSLATDVRFRKFAQNLSSYANFQIFFNSPRMEPLIRAGLTPTLAEKFTPESALKMYSPLSFQFNTFNDLFFANGFIRYDSLVEETTNTLWLAELDTALQAGPFEIVMEDGYPGVAVVDGKSQLYLLDRQGKIKLKKQLDGPVPGKIYQEDYLKNGKQQLIFNTEYSIYLLSLDGREQGAFPIRLPAPATSGLSLVDYDGKKDFRLFVACENEKIYGYYPNGKPLPGWSPKEGVGLVKTEVQQFLVDGKDYLTFHNESGQVFMLDRKGVNRVDPFEMNTSFIGPFRVEIAGTTFRMINADTSGVIYKLYPSGTFVKFEIKEVTSADAFLYMDLTGDGKKEYVILDSAEVRGFNEEKKQLFSYNPGFMVEPQMWTVSIPYSEAGGIGLFSKEMEKVILLNTRGLPSEGFPLTGASQFIISDMLKNNSRILVTADRAGVITAYRVW